MLETLNKINVIKQVLIAANQFKYVKDMEVLGDDTIQYKLIGLDNVAFTATVYKPLGKATRVKLITKKTIGNQSAKKTQDILLVDFYNLMYAIYLKVWENKKITEDTRAFNLKDVVAKYEVNNKKLMQNVENFTEEVLDTWLVKGEIY
jgi:hypothetical protein